MGTITLVGTFHEELGRVSASELARILVRIRPDVLFLEAPVATQDWRGDFAETKPVESGAVAKYLAANPAKAIPVDLRISPEAYLRNSLEVLRYVAKVSGRYCDLIDKNKSNMIDGGFVYLNCETHNGIQCELHAEISRILDLRDSPPLSQAYSDWRGQDEAREIEMLSNIEKYGCESGFHRAVFLVGAAHRASIVEKSIAQAFSSSSKAQWDYSSSWARDDGIYL